MFLTFCSCPYSELGIFAKELKLLVSKELGSLRSSGKYVGRKGGGSIVSVLNFTLFLLSYMLSYSDVSIEPPQSSPSHDLVCSRSTEMPLYKYFKAG